MSFDPSDLAFPLLGGLFLAFSSSTLLNDYGKIFGCSGALHNIFALSSSPIDTIKLGLITGLTLTGSVVRLFLPTVQHTIHAAAFDEQIIQSQSPSYLAFIFVSGGFVGLGTKLGGGCTSGHMLCGVARASKRSLVATIIFFPTAVLIHRVIVPLLSKIGLIPSPLWPFIARDSNFGSSIKSETPLNITFLIAFFSLPYVIYWILRSFSPHERFAFLKSAMLGSCFASGLVLSGMTNPSTVLGFFDFPIVSWNPSLLGVAIAGLGLNAIFFWGSSIRSRIMEWKAWSEKLESSDTESDEYIDIAKEIVLLAPIASKRGGWQLPELSNNIVDRKLLIGSTLFGIGWGLAGICPGPAMVNLGCFPTSYTVWCWFFGFLGASKII